MRLKARFHALLLAFGEAFTCLALALRSSLRPGILLGSSGLCLLLFGLVSWLFYAHYELLGSAAGLLSLFVVYGAAVLGLLPGISGSAAGIPGMAGIAPALALLLLLAAALTLLILALLYVGLILLGIRLSLRWVLMGSLRRRALQAYPQLAGRRSDEGPSLLGLRYRIAPWLGLGIGPLLCLLVPLLNGVLLLLLFAYLNVRLLMPAAFAGIASGRQQMQAVRQQRGAICAFGLLVLLLACVPLINLLLPALFGAGTCHLAYRGLLRAEAATGAQQAAQVSLPPP